MVIRAAARTDKFPLGLPLSTQQGKGQLSYTFDVARVQQRLLRIRALGLGESSGTSESEVELTQDLKGLISLFPDRRDWTLNPARLHIVAFVQDAKTGEVLQAQMMPVQNSPHDKRLEIQ
jgi:hypothetical protein